MTLGIKLRCRIEVLSICPKVCSLTLYCNNTTSIIFFNFKYIHVIYPAYLVKKLSKHLKKRKILVSHFSSLVYFILQVLDALQKDVDQCFKVLPTSVHNLLRRTQIWVNYSYCYGPRHDPKRVTHTTAHHGEGWLIWYVPVPSIIFDYPIEKKVFIVICSHIIF